ncbi:MAG: glycoside hydrolase family 3 C-terminal domain-containing protein, partial [Clostridiales bacterium]|nr:glycoside hydrolase family 3 C-terminal domain-containing protein [Clostridiales bacterium]
LVLLCVGEQSYAEWNGDTEDLELCGALGLPGNKDAIDEAGKSGKPTVTCIVAGRHVILDKKDYGNWDSVVMCYLPGSEGKGISDVLCGCADFRGKLPSPWYGSVDEIGTDKCFLERGYGLNYGDGFTARTEPDMTADKPAEDTPVQDPMAGTNYTKGLFKDGDYVNDYADIQVSIPSNLHMVSEDELNSDKKQNLAEIADEDDKRVESATTWDAWFVDSGNGFSFNFINLDQAFPDDPDFSEEDFLDYYMKRELTNLSQYNIKVDDKGRSKVKLGDQEYVSQYVILSQEGGSEQKVCGYVRKLDDKLMCIIEIYYFGDKDPSVYEKMFK